jgi:DNA modification methylase
VAAMLTSRGFPVLGEVVWDKASPGLGGGIRYQHETVLLAAHGKPAGRGSLFSVIRAFVSREGKHRRHPHEKPVALMAALVRYCARPAELVLDPFAGSGSTLVACAKTGRRGIGLEIDPRYLPDVRRGGCPGPLPRCLT